jgi:plasmid maintenance system killer protein
MNQLTQPRCDSQYTTMAPSKPRSHPADTLRALPMLPSCRLEALKGDRRGQDSMWINQSWRVCLKWREDGPHHVEIVVDY